VTSRLAELVRVCVATLVVLAVSERADASCTVQTTSNASFGASVTSFVVKSTPQMASTTNAGLTCTGAVLSILQSGDHIYGTVTSLRGGLLGPTGDVVPYTTYADGTTAYPIALGVAFDYAAQGPLLSLLGLFGGSATALPLYFRTAAGVNVAAGTYTDTISIAWNWNYCSGIGAFGICLGRDIGSGNSSFTVTLIVTNACEVTIAPSVDFGRAPSASSFAPINQSIGVRCTKGLASYSVGINTGQHATGAGQRRMAGAGSFLAYELYKSGTTVWGTMGVNRAANTLPADGTSEALFPYTARIDASQTTPPVGEYDDLVVIDVTF
jgi:spore coat protein U-like protein